jgi:hypothetical protein
MRPRSNVVETVIAMVMAAVILGASALVVSHSLVSIA